MKIKRNSIVSGKKSLIIVGMFALLFTGFVSAYFFLYKASTNSVERRSPINYGTATDDQKKAGEQTKENSVNPNDSSKPNTSGSDQAANPIQQDSGKGRVSATLTTANQKGSTLQIRFDLGTITNSGTCTLILKKGGSTVTKTAGVQALAGSSACTGFDVATSELSPGTWQVALHFEDNSLVADTTGSVDVK